MKKQQKPEKFAFFYKKMPKNFASFRKSCTFAPAKRNKSVLKAKFGVWCNGNTADSGPAFPGSSPGTPTQTRLPFRKPFLCPVGRAFIVSRGSLRRWP